MTKTSYQTSLPEILRAALPRACNDLANDVSHELLPFVEKHSRFESNVVEVAGDQVQIPQRLIISCAAGNGISDHLSIGANCLLTRSTDGYLRQRALRKILAVHEPWAIPFVVLLIGEYVVEIIEDICAAMSAFDQAAYAEFITRNRPLMRLISEKSTSYWNCYYRRDYPERSSYPGWIVLRELNRWTT